MDKLITASGRQETPSCKVAPQSHRTERRGYRTNPRSHAPGRSQDRSVGGRWRVGAIAGLACALSACGGSNSPSVVPTSKAQTTTGVLVPASDAAASSPTVTQPASSVAANNPQDDPPPIPSGPAATPIVLIDAFGDDAAMGLSGYNFGMPVIVKAPAAYLQDALQKQFADTGIKVSDRATGGRAASLMNALDGMDGGAPPLAQRLTSTQSSIVIVSYSLNEAYAGETVSDFSGYLAQAIQAIQSAGRKAVLEEPSPTCDTDHPQLAQYATAIDAASKQYGVPVIQQYAYIQTIPDWKLHMDSTCTLPDAWLNSIKANQELAVIAPLVATQIGE